mgnify:CR=1 FL=1
MHMLQVIRQVSHEANLCAQLRHDNIVEFLGGDVGVGAVVMMVAVVVVEEEEEEWPLRHSPRMRMLL